MRDPSRRHSRTGVSARRAAAALAGAVLAWRAPAAAQQADSARIGARPAPVAAPSRRPGTPVDPAKVAPLAPGAAFLRSALLPGLGQAQLDRPVAGAVFFVAEVFSLAMWRKAAYDLREARRWGADSVVIGAFQTSNGREARDTLGRPIPATPLVPNRWVQGNIGAARSTFREDWIAAVVFVHLLAGIDAFVAAQLWDLPAQVSLRPGPMGGATISLGYRWR